MVWSIDAGVANETKSGEVNRLCGRPLRCKKNLCRMRIYHPTFGEVLIDGKALQRMHPEMETRMRCAREKRTQGVLATAERAVNPTLWDFSVARIWWLVS